MFDDRCQFWAGPFCLHLVTGWMQDHEFGKRVQLTRAECLLWQSLAVAAPGAVTRPYLGAVLGSLKGAAVSERGVRIVVCRLRSHLVRLGRASMLDTGRGGLYRLCIPAEIEEIQPIQELQRAA
jgi:DNA-binding response OmpR family regulator